MNEVQEPVQTEEPAAPAAPEIPAVEPQKAEEPTAPAADAPKDPSKPIAAGGTDEPADPEHKPFWNDEWRHKMAEHAAAGDKKAYDRELKRLERISDPSAIYGMYRELDNKLNGGGLIKVPGKDASEDEIKNFQKALGVPEKPDEYVKNLSLPDGIKLGDQDKQLAGDFATDMHAAGLTQSQMDMALAWYFKNEEGRAAFIDQEDDKNRKEGLQELKEEWGPSLNRHTNAIPSLFAYAPGGADLDNDKSLFNRLLTGRMADGRIIGDDPDMTRFLVNLAKEINPVATVVDDAGGRGKSIEEELKEISQLRRTDRPAYNKDVKLQERERELLAAQQKQQARA